MERTTGKDLTLKKLLRENNDVNLGMIDEINKTAEEHVKKEHIVPSTSPWAFGIVPVKKKQKQTVV